MGQAADFFISYTSADRAWAEWIAWQLEAEGYQVVVQAWDFVPGRDWAHEMQQATITARRVVTVLSSAYLQSGHGEAEWRVFYAMDPSGERGLLSVASDGNPCASANGPSASRSSPPCPAPLPAAAGPRPGTYGAVHPHLNLWRGAKGDLGQHRAGRTWSQPRWECPSTWSQFGRSPAARQGPATR
jgi:hypothetical protein